jgi:HEAT repeat protein
MFIRDEKIKFVINELKKDGEKALLYLLNIAEGEIDYPVLEDIDSRDAYSKILIAISKIGLGHKDYLIELFSKEINKTESTQKFILSLSSVIGSLKSKKAVVPLVKSLNHKMEFVRWNSCESLKTLKSKDCISALIKALRDKSDLVRLCAIESMQSFGDDNAIPELRRLLNDKKKGIRYEAKKAIEKINSRLAKSK